MRKWLSVFISEKGLDLEDTFEFENSNGYNLMPYGVVVEAIHGCNDSEYQQIKMTLIKIDFHNGDVYHFLRHLGRGLAA